MPSDESITELLRAASQGDTNARDRVIPLMYEELRNSAHRELARFRRGGTLSTTAVVHEAYLKLFRTPRAGYDDRNHFHAVAATVMRQVLVDHARQQLTQKRGQGQQDVSIERVEIASPAPDEEILAIDEALKTLGVDHPRLVQVVELRYFAGLSVEETSAALGVSERTVKHDFQKARALLLHLLGGGMSVAHGGE
jgi:RNA polymerase sigma factor (TIGR02999 family)